MRIVVTGATGNVGTSVLRSLGDDPTVESIVGIARRLPSLQYPKTAWVRADVSRDELAHHFRGADVVIHLAWLIQPSRDLRILRATNVDGSRRVFGAVADAGVPAFVYASSVGAYSPGPKDRGVDESWPTNGVPSSFYSRHKAETERMLDVFERENASIRVVRLRPALIFKRDAASGVRRLFAGPFLPTFLLRRHLIPIVPNVPGLRFQAVHSHDVGEAYRLAATQPVRGAFNIAADPVLDPDELAEMFGARRLSISRKVLRSGASVTWRLHLQPTPPGWVDLGLQSLILDARRARGELGWSPRYTSKEALAELVAGMREKAGLDTPPLAPRSGGPFRIKELVTGVGRKSR